MASRQVAEPPGVNVSTIYNWLRRFANGGEEALRGRGSRPHRGPRRLAVQPVATIIGPTATTSTTARRPEP